MRLVDPVVAIAERQLGLVKDVQLLGLGMSRWAIARRVQSGLIESAYPGVYRMAAGLKSWRQELLGACLWANQHLPDDWPGETTAVVSHEAAAALLGLDGFQEGPVVLTTPRLPQFKGSRLTVHRGWAEQRFTVMHDGIIPVTKCRSDPGRLGGPNRSAVRAGDGRGAPPTLRQASSAAMDCRSGAGRQQARSRGAWGTHGQPGARRILAILDGRSPLDGPSASAFQKDVRIPLLSGGLRIIEEHVVRSADGSFVARADLELEYDVEVEAQRAKHHSSWAAQQADLHATTRSPPSASA